MPLRKVARKFGWRSLARQLCFGASMGLSVLAAAAPSGSWRTATVLHAPGPRAELLDLASGRSQRLPVSETTAASSTGRDLWVANRHARELVREDGANGISIYAWPGLEQKAGFRLQSRLPSSARPTLSSLRPSPDGRFFAALEWGRDALHAVVFDRSGRLVLQGGEYKSSSEMGGFEWLPDGRLLFMERGELLMHELKSGRSTPLPVAWPAEATGNGGLSVSPDGGRLAVVRLLGLRRSDGRSVAHAVIYLIQDGRVQLLVRPAAARVESGLALGISDLQWSADGRSLGFAVDVGNDRYGAGLAVRGCPKLYVIEVPAAVQAAIEIDGVRDTAQRLQTGGGPAGARALESCRGFSWLW